MNYRRREGDVLPDIRRADIRHIWWDAADSAPNHCTAGTVYKE